MGSTVLTLEETIELIRKYLPEYDRKAIMKMIEEKRQELGPEIVNEESAAMIVARELGIDLQQVSSSARQKIEDISEDLRNVALTAKVVHIGTVRTFTRKDGGGEGKVASIKVADESGQIRVAMWDDQTKIVSEEAISVGNVIQIRGAYVKKGLRDALELNLGRMGGIRLLEDYELEDFEITVGEPQSNKISDLAEGMYDLTLSVKVERVFPMSTFTRKTDDSEGKVLSMIVGDDSGTTRMVFWDDLADTASEIQEGEVIQLTGGMSRAGRNDGEIEVHASRSSSLERNLKMDISVKSEKMESDPAEALGRLSISEMKVGMKDVDIEGKVYKIFPPNQFEKDGKAGQVQNIIIVDESGKTVRAAFWHGDVDKIKDLKEEDVIRVRHGYVKKGYRDDIEFGVGRISEIEINPKDSKISSMDIKVSIESYEGSTTEPLGRVKIEDMQVGMRDVDIEGKVYRIFPLNKFEKDGKPGQVQNIIIVDESGKSITTAFWHEDVDKIKDISEGDIIRVRHGYVKKGYRDDIEFGVGQNAEIEVKPKDSKLKKLKIEGERFAPVVVGDRTLVADVDDSFEGSTLEVCGIIVAVGQVSPVYPACPECRKKVEYGEDSFSCREHGNVKPEYRMLYKITIDDGSGTIRATLFGESGEELLGMTAQEAQDLIDKSKNDKAPIEKNSDRILGSYVVVKGRISKYKDQLDITASSLSFADPATEIERMKASIEDYLD